VVLDRSGVAVGGGSLAPAVLRTHQPTISEPAMFENAVSAARAPSGGVATM
jgi:hypothetical protein